MAVDDAGARRVQGGDAGEIRFEDAGFGAVWFVVALFFLFWAIPVLLVFAIGGIASWWHVWLSALAVFGILILAVLFFALLGLLKFRKVLRRENPAQAVATDVRIVKEAGDNDEF